MTAHDRRHLRAQAIATLTALGGVVLGVLLTLAFPRFGMPQPYSGFLYFPPQALLAGLLAPTAVVFAFAASINGLRQSRRAGQPRWTGAFMVVLLLLVIFPAHFICAFGVGCSVFALIPGLQDLGSQPDTWWLLAESAVAVVAMAGVCALVYASKAISPRRLLQGRE